MFALLKINENPTDLFSRIKYAFNKPVPTLSRINVKGGAPFYYLEIFRSECGEQLEGVKEILGRCSQYLVLCDSYYIPDTPNAKLFYPQKLPQLALINTAVSFYQSLGKEPLGVSLGFVDERALLVDYIEQFIGFASIIRIYTKLPEKYKYISERLFDEYGVSIIITQCIESVSECDFYISPSYNTDRKLNRTFSYADEQGRRIVYKGKEIALPDDINSLKPNNTDSLLFASALYELCGVKRLKSIKFSRLEVPELNN